MQALKTIADSALFTSVCEPIPQLRSSTALVSGNGVLYVAADSSMSSFDIISAHNSSSLQLNDRGQDFQEPLAITRAMALVSNGSLLMAWGASRPAEPTLSTTLSFWSVRTSARLVEKVREVPVQSPFGGALSNWAWFDGEGSFTVALAFSDIHCSVQLLTFRKGDTRPQRPAVHLIQVAKDSNGDAAISNMHLLKFENPVASPKPTLRLFVTLTQHNGPGKIESRDVQSRDGEVVTLEHTDVAYGQSTEYGSSEVIVFTSAEQGSGLKTYSTQVCTFLPDARVACLPYQYPVVGPVGRVDTHTVAVPVRNLRSDPCIAVIDGRNRLELSCHVLRKPLKSLVAARDSRGVLIVHTDGAVTALLPKSLSQQIGHITQRKHYKEAIGVARDALARTPAGSQEAAATKELIAQTEAKFATHLLERAGEPEAAMQHYIQTIGYLSVSTVIQKFLDTAHLPLLKQYMEEVARDSSVMRPAYAAVLLSLYVQLQDKGSLSKFIDKSINDKGYMWDVDEAISTCLNGGYYAEAKRVAQASSRHAAVVDICMYHTDDISPSAGAATAASTSAGAAGAAKGNGGREALKYIKSLDRADRALLLQQHGHVLISKFKLEMEVTPIVEELCQPILPRNKEETLTSTADIYRFVLLYDDAPGALRVLCDKLLQEWLSALAQVGDVAGEAPNEIKLLFHLLLELLLDPLENQGPDGLPEDLRHLQALALLERGWPGGVSEPLYQQERVLHLCHFYSFKDGLLFLFTRLRDITRQLQVLVEYGEWAALAQLGLEHPGERGHHLEVVLRELVNEADRNPSGEAPGHIRTILDRIPKDGNPSEVLPPLSVVAALQRSSTLTLAVCKTFLQDHLRRLQAKAEHNGSKIEQLQAETAELSERVHKKRTEPLVVDPQAIPGERLGPSAVFFFCGHSFDEDTCARRPDTGDFICSICQTDPEKQHIRRTAPAEEVDRAKINEQFFSEIRNPNASVFDVVGRFLDNYGFLI